MHLHRWSPSSIHTDKVVVFYKVHINALYVMYSRHFVVQYLEGHFNMQTGTRKLPTFRLEDNLLYLVCHSHPMSQTDRVHSDLLHASTYKLLPH